MSLIPHSGLARIVGKPLRAALLFCSALIAAASLPAAAQDAMWLATPGSADYNAGANWSGGSVQRDTAAFGSSDTTDGALVFASNSTAASTAIINNDGRYVLFRGNGTAKGVNST